MKNELEQQLIMLENEMQLIQDTINRVREYSNENQQSKWRNSHSIVMGELKNRCKSLRPRLSRIQKFNTYDLYE